MSITKKIKLNSSLNAINGKAAAAGKRKVVPKFKTILANPYQPTNELLSPISTCELKGLIHYEIVMSGCKGREFVKEHKIFLGLQSSLRAINDKKTSCVLVSHTIKPKYVINQIVYFSKQKCSNVPVYVVNDLGAFSESMFGVRALVIAFPLKLPGKLGEWISKRNSSQKENKKKKKPKPPPKKVEEFKNLGKVDLDSIYLHKNPDGARAFIPEKVVKTDNKNSAIEIYEWAGDFIPFKTDKSSASNNEYVSKTEFEKEKDKVLKALRGMTNNVQCKQLGAFSNGSEKPKETKLPKIVYEENDDDDFLSQHKGVGVVKVQVSAKSKPKKKIVKKQIGKKNDNANA